MSDEGGVPEPGHDALSEGTVPVLRSLRLQPLGRSLQTGDESLLAATIARAGAAIHCGARMMLDIDADRQSEYCVVVVDCEPLSGGFFDAATTLLAVEALPLPVMQRCHILPFVDACPEQRDLTIQKYVMPFVERSSCQLIEAGFEFAHAGCRFKVMACDPAVPAVLGPQTEVYWEGPALERRVLTKVAVLPYSNTLPPPGPDGQKPDLHKEYVLPYFQQKSSPLNPGDEFEHRGVRFRVVHCEPPGAGPADSTQVSSEGLALIECAIGDCHGLATRRCGQASCGRTLCAKHAMAIVQDGSSKVFCPEHAPSSCKMM
eukprot:TRINITY_DN110537_c0_g1_i1.p1 TRINITY_DN110537_c0_g1~~TRINITY_DN110537_c0_g1_i1.p1  ORF type:complete len:317 (+),score=58.33 TRINITY_DN110537_c0_g1_i1:20-970(+)